MKVLFKNMGDSQISNIIAAQAKKGFWDGGSHTSYFDECRFHVLKYNALAIFTRDVGYHGGKTPTTKDATTYHFPL